MTELGFSYSSERLGELGLLSLQELPLSLPLLVRLPRCGQLCPLSRGPAVTQLQLLLSAGETMHTVHIRVCLRAMTHTHCPEELCVSQGPLNGPV